VKWLKISTNYSYQSLDNNYTVHKQQYPPKNKANLKLFFTLPKGINFSLLTGYVGKTKWEIPTVSGGYTSTMIDAHTRVDGKIGYFLERNRTELFLSWYNLLDEKVNEYPFAEKIGRRVIGGATYSF
jgi:hypothetical protein